MFLKVRAILIASIFLISACHPMVSQFGQYGLVLNSAKAIHWTTGPNGFEGVTYEFEIENPKRKEVVIESIWVEDGATRVNFTSKKSSFTFSATSSNDVSGAEWLSSPNPTEVEAACVITYSVAGKKFYWVIEQIEQNFPAYDHLPE